MSTAHHDIFRTIVRCLDGAKWLEPCEETLPDQPKPPENEYGKNFRSVIKEALKT